MNILLKKRRNKLVMDEEESEDTNFVSCIVKTIIIFILGLLFRAQIVAFFIWLFTSVQAIIR